MRTYSRLLERHSKAALLASTTAALILVLAGVLLAAELDAPGNRAVAPGGPTTMLPSNDADENVVSVSVTATAS